MKKTILALAMLGSFGAATNAQAYAYAYAYDEVSNLNMLPGSSGISISPIVVNNSNALSCLNGTCVSTGGAGTQDAPFALVGAITAPATTPYVSNTYNSHELSPTAFSLADADITSTAGLISSARNFAEAKLINTSTANGSAGNSSIQSIEFTVDTAGGFFNFNFNAAPYLRAFLTAGSVLPSSALAALSMSINIVGDQGNTDAASRGLVFNWAPDGIVVPVTVANPSNILGGVETKDFFTLNTSVTATTLAPAPLDYNPTQCAVGPCFAAYTNNLLAGAYTLNVVMNEQDNVLLVPEPGSIMLLGIGLAALGGFTRRRSMRPALPA